MNHQSTSTWAPPMNGIPYAGLGMNPLVPIGIAESPPISRGRPTIRFDITRAASEGEEFGRIQELFEKGERDHAFSMMDDLLGFVATPSNYLQALRILLRQGEASTAGLLAAEAHRRFPSNARIAKVFEVLRPPTARHTTGKAIDRSREIQWLGEHGREYRGKWVVLLGDQLIVASDSAAEALEKAKNCNSTGRPMVYQVSSLDAL